MPFGAARGDGVLELARRGAPFDPDDSGSPRSRRSSEGWRCGSAPIWRPPATVRGRWTSPAMRSPPSPPTTGPPARVARLAAAAAGGDAALVWRLRDDALEVVGAWGPIAADETLQGAADAVVGKGTDLVDDGTPRAGGHAAVLGQPVLGALQVRFAPGRCRRARPRAARRFRRPRRARAALVRARGRPGTSPSAAGPCSRSSGTRSRSLPSHTLKTAIERVAHLLGVDRVAIYLTEDGRMAAAASHGREGPVRVDRGRAPAARRPVAGRWCADRRGRGRAHGRRARAGVGADVEESGSAPRSHSASSSVTSRSASSPSILAWSRR